MGNDADNDHKGAVIMIIIALRMIAVIDDAEKTMVIMDNDGEGDGTVCY